MGKKSKRRNYYEKGTDYVNESDGDSQVREKNGSEEAYEGDMSRSHQDPPPVTVTRGRDVGKSREDQLGFDLQPYTHTVYETTQTIAVLQKQFHKLSEQYLKHAADIENVTEIYLQFSNLERDVREKDAKIQRQKDTIIELRSFREDEEVKLAKQRERVQEDEKRLEKEKEDHGKRLKKEEDRLEVRKAEMEVEKQKVLEEALRKQKEKAEAEEQQRKSDMADLQAAEDELTKKLEAKQKKMEDLQEQLKAVKGTLDDSEAAKAMYKKGKEELEAKLRKVQNEFGLTTQKPEFYKEKFADIANNIDSISSTYFCNLPSDDFDRIHKDLIALDKSFSSVPIFDDETSEKLRVARVQQIISTALYTHIWQPFSSDQDATSSPVLGRLYAELANENNRRAATVWKVLTMRALQSQDQHSSQNPKSASPSTSAETSQYATRAKEAVQEILTKLSSLISPTQKLKTSEELLQLAQSATELWNQAQADELEITASLTLLPSERNLWRSSRFDPEDGTTGEQEIKSSTHPRIYTLFPQITAHPTTDSIPHHIPGYSQTSQEGGGVNKIVIHSGTGLPEWSTLVLRGKADVEENEAYFRKAMEDAKKKRRSGSSVAGSISMSTSGPLSPSSAWVKVGKVTKVVKDWDERG